MSRLVRRGRQTHLRGLAPKQLNCPAMSFGLFLLYVVMTFIRPFELFLPDWAQYRPMLVLALLALTVGLHNAATKKEWGGRATNIKLMLGMIGVIVLSGLFSGYAGSVQGSLSNFLPSAILYLLVLLNVTSMQRLKWACGVTALSIAAAGTMSITAYHTGWYAKELVQRQLAAEFGDPLAVEALGAPPDTESFEDIAPAQETSGWWLWRIRGAGPLNDANDFSQAMVMALPLLWGLWRKRQVMFNTMFVAIPSAVMGYVIYLTHSRGAILGLGVIVLFEIRRRFGKMAASVLLGLGAFAALALSVGGRGFTSQEKSAGDRIEAWSNGFEMLKSRPLFGIGMDNFVERSDSHLTAHNSFVLCFSELGLVGYFVWLGIIVYSFRSLLRVVQVLPPSSVESRAAGRLMAALAGFLTCAWFLSRSYTPQLFLMSGLAMTGWYVGTQERVARLEGSKTHEQIHQVTWIKPTLYSLIGTVLLAYAFVKLHGMSAI